MDGRRLAPAASISPAVTMAGPIYTLLPRFRACPRRPPMPGRGKEAQAAPPAREPSETSVDLLFACYPPDTLRALLERQNHNSDGRNPATGGPNGDVHPFGMQPPDESDSIDHDHQANQTSAHDEI